LESWEGADLREFVARAVEMHGDGPARVRIVGPAVQLSSKMTISLSMAIHELTTNAMKYGALSNERGAVEVVPSDAGPRLKLQWREVAGPRVITPEKKGFGSRLIERGLAAELGGEATIIFEPAGVICLIEAPLPATEPAG
jgi:two-component sensor histidine kinase